MIPLPTSYPNEGVARTIKRRHPVVGFALGVLLGGFVYWLFSLRPQGPPSLTVAIPMFAIIIVWMTVSDWLAVARAVCFVSAPVSIHFSSVGEGVVGDFRRTGSAGPPFREIRFQDVGRVGPSLFLRIPVIARRPGSPPEQQPPASRKMYLTPENLERVRAAYAQYKRGLQT